VTKRPDGTDRGLHVVIVNGSEKGPVLLIDGVHHGTELAGYEAILKLASELDPKKLKGTFIGVPVMDVEGFQDRDRIGHVDYLNMNRVYPGNDRGYDTVQVAFAYFNEIVPKANYLISCHGARAQRSPLTYVVPPAWDDSETVKKSQEMAKAFGVELIELQKQKAAGRLTTHSVEKGIPSMITEIGGNSDVYQNRWHYIDLHKRGFTNVMKHLGMLEGRPMLPQKQIYVVNDVLYNKYGGLWIPEVKGSLEGQPKVYVKKGTILGRVVNPFNMDEEIERIVAPYDGLIIGLFYQPVLHPGDHVIYFGKILKEEINSLNVNP